MAIAALAPVLGPEALYTHDVSFTPPRSVARSTMVDCCLLDRLDTGTGTGGWGRLRPKEHSKAITKKRLINRSITFAYKALQTFLLDKNGRGSIIQANNCPLSRSVAEISLWLVERNLCDVGRHQPRSRRWRRASGRPRKRHHKHKLFRSCMYRGRRGSATNNRDLRGHSVLN